MATSAAPRTPSSSFSFSLETPSLSSGTLDKYLKSVLGESSSTAIPELLRSSQPQSQTQSQSNTPPPTERPQHAFSSPPAPSSSGAPVDREPESNGHQFDEDKEAASGSSSSAPAPSATRQDSGSSSPAREPNEAASDALHQLAMSGMEGQVVPSARGQNYIDITDHLNMPQSEAAKKLGIPPSTLSKRWKEAVRKRKWPYRIVSKIDKEIMTLLHNVPQGPNAPPLSEDIETALGGLLRSRQEELRPVVIRI